MPEEAHFCPTCGEKLASASRPLIAGKIIDYRDLIANSTQGFVGRAWLREAIDDFLPTGGERYSC